MSQFDFGVIDPYVVDGVQLADDLNQFRDALLSYHRGPARPPYVVAGMLWINDAGGPTNWILNVYISPTIGDRPLFQYDTTTGNITIAIGAGSTVSAAVLLAQAAASPSVQWNATGNPIDAKAWRMTVNGAGALVLASYNDAGVLQNSITFNRDGTIASAPRLGAVTAGNGSWSNSQGVNNPIVFGTIISGNTPGNWLNTTTGRYTPPAGRFWIQCAAGMQAPTSGGNGTWTLLASKNGVVIPGTGIQSSGVTGFSIGLTLGLYVDANGTDYFQFHANPAALPMNVQGATFSAFSIA